jgi:serine protease Do
MKRPASRLGSGAAVPATLALIWIAAGLCSTPAWGFQPPPGQASPAPASSVEQQVGHEEQVARALSGAFEHAANVIRPSVVNIESVKHIEVSQRVPRELREFFGSGDLFEKFFSESRKETEEGLGSGLIVSADGLILTNNHVVEDAERVQVRLSAPDEREFTASVVGADPLTDLAVIKINATGLSAAKLGNSDELRVGELVAAVGNPFGLNSTMTSGIVSATGRANVGIADYEDFIQTDAAINPGNSGGPLVNLRGEVIGITTAIFTRSGGYMGIGFAIPSNMVEKVMPQLISEGRVVRGWLGVAIQNLTEGLARSFDYDSTKGVLVADVTPDSPAAKAGLERGDIIISFGGRPTLRSGELRSMVADTKPGTSIPLEVFRDGKKMPLEVVVGELPQPKLAAHEEKAAPGSPTRMGITIHDLSPDLAKELHLPSEQRGVVITKVQPLSPADRAGLNVGDVIASVQGHPIANIEDFKTAIASLELSAGIRMQIVSHTKQGTLRRFAFVQAGH